MKSRTMLHYASALGLSLLLIGCQQSATAPDSRQVSAADLQFVTGLTNLVEFDHRVIGSEMKRAADPRVRSLAIELLARVDAFSARVRPIAAREGISPPQAMSLFEQSDMHTRIASLMATSRIDFDQEFISDELAGNREVLAQAEQVVKGPSSDPEMHALANEAVSRLREDVSRLENLQRQLGQ